MTKPQTITLMRDWWPRACRAQGWDPADRNHRLAVLSEAVGRPVASASHLNTTTDVDKVKAHLLALCDNLDAARECDDSSIGRARRLRVHIRENLLPCLALYVSSQKVSSEPSENSTPSPRLRGEGRGEVAAPSTLNSQPSTASGAEAYLQTLLASLSRWHRTDRPTVAITLDDLDAAQLDRVIMTLSARIQAKRSAAGDTVHQMKIRAGVQCDCKPCTDTRIRARGRGRETAAEPAHVEQPF